MYKRQVDDDASRRAESTVNDVVLRALRTATHASTAILSRYSTPIVVHGLCRQNLSIIHYVWAGATTPRMRRRRSPAANKLLQELQVRSNHLSNHWYRLLFFRRLHCSSFVKKSQKIFNGHQGWDKWKLCMTSHVCPMHPQHWTNCKIGWSVRTACISQSMSNTARLPVNKTSWKLYRSTIFYRSLPNRPSRWNPWRCGYPLFFCPPHRKWNYFPALLIQEKLLPYQTISYLENGKIRCWTQLSD